MKKMILLPHLVVQNANALSSPYTIGFPAMSAWLGFIHALQRKLNEDSFDEFKAIAVAVISHKADLQTYKGSGDFVHSIIAKGVPLDRQGQRSPFIEEARINLEVTLAIEYDGIKKDDEKRLIEKISHHLNFMRLAGGDILTFKTPILDRVSDEEDVKRFRRKLMPGFALVQRSELMIEAMNDGKDAIDALIHFLAIHNSCDDGDGEIRWNKQRATAGWVVPIAVGFQGISELDLALNQRDDTTPHRFAESVVTLGEFKMPYKIESLDEILWRYRFDEENALYLCENNK